MTHSATYFDFAQYPSRSTLSPFDCAQGSVLREIEGLSNVEGLRVILSPSTSLGMVRGMVSLSNHKQRMK